MFFYITDDDEVFRSMLSQIIEDEELGDVVGEVEDGSFLDAHTLAKKHVDILFIDLLMPIRDGIETIRHIAPSFKGKIIMISQVESKELIGEAYSLGIEYYITKPLNRNEVLSVIQKVMERIRLERSIQDIQKSLSNVFDWNSAKEQKSSSGEKKITDWGQVLLSELGIAGENGSKDLLEIIDYLYHYETRLASETGFPILKDIFTHISLKKLGTVASQDEVDRERKASEQRVRRAIYQSLNHLASLGLADFANQKFENYASMFFDFTTVRQRMTELKQASLTSSTHTRINAKKFIQVLYFEAKQLVDEEY
ncbi:two-component system, response regulator YcbB [Bacillus sp. OV166]|uniref:response regulator n=1 Tax=Bacillus sp. OV166 TaxID=1882763 RepID=UPI000A2AEB27|nr:response regulator [Bacillus sp. OV166]SMQ60330.1 two-component system, response regulator YcbB [Bacillus sp. OV166]